MTIEIVNLLEEVVQRAGFEPANRYGLGPHPSAFDQAGRLLRAGRRSVLLYLNTPTGHLSSKGSLGFVLSGR